ncbi:MAG: hypothetical protein Q9182_001941 [Xanthomendoza sp. 2 TL-2023]
MSTNLLHSNGSFEEVPNQGMAVYYEGRGDNRDLQPFPPGFRMVSGNMRLRSYKENIHIPGSDRPLSDRVSFACLDGTINKEQPWLVKTDCKDGLRAQVHFQSCWNGRDLYKPDNSHVEYLSRLDNGDCPSSHPVPLIHLFYEVLYGVNDIEKDGGKFVFSYGDPTGYGFHGDFMNGWEPGVLAKGIKDCAFTRDGGVQYCPAFRPSLDPHFNRNCPERPSLLNEPVHGMIDRLPGCIKVTSGPQDATEADYSCSRAHVRRSEPSDAGYDDVEDEGDYGYGYDFDLPATTTRGPPPSYGSPTPDRRRSKRSEPFDTDFDDEEYGYGYGYDFDLPTTTTRGPPPSYGSPKPRSKRSPPRDTVPDQDYGYGYGYDWDLPTTTTRGPPPSHGSPKPRHHRGGA